MRRNFKRSTHLGKLRGCVATTIRWCFGAGTDPAVAIPAGQLASWCDLWDSTDEENRKRIHAAWRKRMPAIMKGKEDLSLTKGPMTATIRAVRDTGWKPAGPADWRVSENLMACVGGTDYAKAHIVAKALNDLETKVCREAETHSHGKGIGDRIELQPARRAKASLLKEKKLAEAAAVDYIVTGVYQDPIIVEGRPRPDQLCLRCGSGAVATRWHELYECSDNGNILDKAVAGTQWMRDKAKAGWDTNPCLWARGIPPSDWMKCEDDVSFGNARIWETEGFGDVLAESMYGFSDGAGAEKDTPTAARRVASGGAAFKYSNDAGTHNVQRVEGLYAEVPGRQTVPRAEVWAATLVASKAPSKGDLKIGIDASYVVNGIDRKSRLLKGDNGDLWAVLFSILDGRDGTTSPHKIKSHLEDRGAEGIATSRASGEDVIGNALADEFADAGSRAIKVSNAIENELRQHEALAFKVVKRIATIQARIWKAKAEASVYELAEPYHADPPSVEHVAEEIRRRIGKNGHRLTPCKGGHNCERCKTFRGNKRREYWIEHKCTPQWTARQVVEGKRLRVTHEDGDNQLRPQTEADQGEAATPKETQGAAQRAQSSDGLAGSDDGTRIGIAMDDDGDWDEHDMESESAPREAFPEPPEEPGREMMEQGGGHIEADSGSQNPQLVTRRVAAARRKRNALAKAATQKATKVARSTAWGLVEGDADNLNRIVDEEGWGSDVEAAARPDIHSSHNIREARQIEAIFCKTCGAWMQKSRKPRKLAEVCRGPSGRGHVIRLLELGIRPTGGARIPEELKKLRSGRSQAPPH